MRQLHFLRLFADHDQQHHAEQDAGRDQHFSIGKTLLQHKSQDGDDAGQNNAEQRAV